MTAVAHAQAPSPVPSEAPSNPPAHEDGRTQFPAFLINSYFSINVGYIGYEFSDRQLEPGFHAASVNVPHVAARVAVFGHEFNRFLSAQCTYMRPVRYVTYKDVNGDGSSHHVFTHFGSVTVQPRLPIFGRVALFSEAGLGVTSRRGFAREGIPVMRNSHYASLIVGGGLEYRVSPTWNLSAGFLYSPSKPEDNEPRTILLTGGFRYTMRPLPKEVVESNRRTGFMFPRRIIQLEYATGFGYGVNTFLSRRLPVFWGGSVKVDQGIAFHYNQNVFHTGKLFALDFGLSASSWRSRDDHERFFTLSAYPLLQFTILRTKPADLYFSYSLAGPSYVSRRLVDGRDLGSHFTFQDFLGAGIFLGERRSVAVGVKINHYSNGNIFTQNAGLKIPLTLTLGYTF